MTTKGIARGLVVSCQGDDDTPLDDPAVMRAVAWAAVAGGAVAVRIEGLPDLRAVRSTVQVPIIGLVKRRMPGSEVFITPTIEDALAVAEAGADVIAVEATAQPRPDGSTFAAFLSQLRLRTDRPVMADVSTAAEAHDAAAAGAEYVATTLSGFTPYSRHSAGPDLELIREVIGDLPIPLIAEGRFWEPGQVRGAFDLGAHAVCIGDAITNPTRITRRFVEAVPPA